MNNANEKVPVGASLLNDVLDIGGRVMWFPREPGTATAQNWKTITIDRERMVINGVQEIELAEMAEIKVWLREQPSSDDKLKPACQEATG